MKKKILLSLACIFISAISLFANVNELTIGLGYSPSLTQTQLGSFNPSYVSINFDNETYFTKKSSNVSVGNQFYKNPYIYGGQKVKHYINLDRETASVKKISKSRFYSGWYNGFEIYGSSLPGLLYSTGYVMKQEVGDIIEFSELAALSLGIRGGFAVGGKFNINMAIFFTNFIGLDITLGISPQAYTGEIEGFSLYGNNYLGVKLNFD